MARPVGSKNLPKVTPKIDPDVPRVDVRVIERRIANPFGAPETVIPLKTGEPMHLRWFDGATTGRMYRALGELGYVKVPRSLIADENLLQSFSDMGDGWVRRGEKGQEYLCMMPKADWQRIQRAKDDARQKRMRNSKQAKEDLANAVTQSQGGDDEAAAMVLGNHPTVSWTGGMQESVERIELDHDR